MLFYTTTIIRTKCKRRRDKIINITVTYNSIEVKKSSFFYII